MRRLQRRAGWTAPPRLYLDEGPPNWQPNPRSVTAIQEGELDTVDLVAVPGFNNEVRDWHAEGFGNYSAAGWQEFLDDVRAHGIEHPLLVDVAQDGTVSLVEGNHRLQAALQLGLPSVPVEIQYRGNSQQRVTTFGLGAGNYTYDVRRRGWQA